MNSNTYMEKYIRYYIYFSMYLCVVKIYYTIYFSHLLNHINALRKIKYSIQPIKKGQCKLKKFMDNIKHLTALIMNIFHSKTIMKLFLTIKNF